MKIGLISNPLSRANRKSGGVAARVTPGDDICIAQPRDHDQLVDDLSRFAREGVGLIAIDGGDGTVRDIVSNIHYAYGDVWPLIALLPSGKTNVIAGQVGHFGAGDKGWQRLLAVREAGKLADMKTECAAIEISWPGRSDPVQRGFLLGFAAFADGVRMANETIHPMGIAKGLAVAMAIGGVIRRSLLSGNKTRKASGEAGTVLVDGTQINGERHFLVLASTLDRLTLGLQPFWKQGRGAVNWLDIAAPPKRAVVGILSVALGKRKAWMEENGYASGRAEVMEVNFEQPFVLDGELYDPHGHIRITATQAIGFVGE